MRHVALGLALLVVVSFAANSFGAAVEILNLDAKTISSGIGNPVASWTNTGTVGGTFVPTLNSPTPAPTLVAGPIAGSTAVQFHGNNSLGDLSFSQLTVEMTAFMVVAPHSAASQWNGFLSTSAGSHSNDYQTGLNVDQGGDTSPPRTAFSYINFEGAKTGGPDAGNRMLGTTTAPFDTYHVVQINWLTTSPTTGTQQLIFDGVPQKTDNTNNATINMAQVLVGGRDFGGGFTGFLNGNIGAVQLYTGELTPQQENQIGYALASEFGITTAFTPEPSSLLLAALGMVGLLFVGRRAKAAGLKRAVPVAMLMIVLAANMASAGSVNLNFTSTGPGIKDSAGQGTGLTARLSGTGGSLAANDPNLALSTGTGTLSIVATPADLNGQGNLGVGEFLGTNLSSIGYNGTQDFSVSATFSNIQYANNYQQFGVFVGTASNDNLRTGPLNLNGHVPYGVFNNGGDIANLITGVPNASVGDTITLTLARTGGQFTYTQTDTTDGTKSGSYSFGSPSGASGTVNTALNAASDLTVGIYLGNPAGGGTPAPVTETLTNFSVTVTTPEPGSLLMSAMAVVGLGMVIVGRARKS